MTAPIEVDVTTSPIEVTVTSEPPVEVTTALTGTFVEGGGAEQLSELSDVGVTTPTDKNALMADGSLWESRALVEGDISDLGSYIDTTGVTFENLDTNSDVGTGVSQVAAGNHTHSGVYEPAGVSAADITDSTADGRALLTSADANPFTDANASTLGAALQPDDADIGEAIEDTDKSHVFNTSASASVTATFSRLWTWILSKMPFASQAEMEAGTETSTRSMSPERVKQAIDALSSGGDYEDGGEAGGADRTLGNTDSFDLGFLTDNTTRLHVQSDGNVGIGTASPETKLDVNGRFRASSHITIGGSPTTGTGFEIFYSSNVGAGFLSSIDRNTTNDDLKPIRFEGAPISFWTGNDLTDDAERMSITSAGNVGIGTASPQNLLDVNAGAVIGSSYAGVETAPTDGLLVEGNVGVGTADPQVELDVIGAVRSTDTTTGSYAQFTESGANLYPRAAFLMGDTSGSFNNVALWAAPDGTAQKTATLEALTNADTSTNLTKRAGLRVSTTEAILYVARGTGSSGDIPFGISTQGTSGTPAIHIDGDSSQKVGIGTITPTAQLDIVGTAYPMLSITRSISSSSSFGSTFALSSSQGTVSSPTALVDTRGVGTIFFSGYDGTNYETGAEIRAVVNGTPSTGVMPTDLIFSTRDAAGSGVEERIRINKDGDVGIGTDSPQNLLDVNAGAVIGSSYAGVETAPTDGLLVEGNVGIGTTAPDTLLDINGAITQRPLSADPSDPDDGNSVQWVSDGTGSGDVGDVMMKITVGATTKTITVADFSAA